MEGSRSPATPWPQGDRVVVGDTPGPGQLLTSAGLQHQSWLDPSPGSWGSWPRVRLDPKHGCSWGHLEGIHLSRGVGGSVRASHLSSS